MSHDENRFPHADDCVERRTSDNGFSNGWGLHHKPAESYIVDCHTHMKVNTKEEVQNFITRFFERAAVWRLERLIALDGKPENIDAFAHVSEQDSRFLWLVWLRHDKPDIKFFRDASKKQGFAGLKLHNQFVIQDGHAHTVWQSPEWAEIFDLCAELKKPVLWHVTQRHTQAPYTGGGKDSYWKIGWPKGVKYTNQDLLDIFLERVEKHKRTNFIGPHHLHMGIEKVGAFLKKYDNLSIDFSVGNIVRPFDEMYPADRETWRNYTIQFQDRLMFGTDCAFGVAENLWYLWETLAAHIRFIHQLNLPKAALEKVMHENIERLVGLEPIIPKPVWGFVRP
jgi:predicted TIM-barrel fold metal-dependent hydrolase